MAQALSLTLERVKDTKNMVRFEVPADGPPNPPTDTIYISKAAHAEIGSPQRIKIRIEPTA